MTNNNWWKGKSEPDPEDQVKYKDLKIVWEICCEVDITPGTFIYKGNTYHLVGGRWSKGTWVEKRYETADGEPFMGFDEDE